MTRTPEQRMEQRQEMTIEQRVDELESLADQFDAAIAECEAKHKRDAKKITLLASRVAELEKASDGS